MMACGNVTRTSLRIITYPDNLYKMMEYMQIWQIVAAVF